VALVIDGNFQSICLTAPLLKSKITIEFTGVLAGDIGGEYATQSVTTHIRQVTARGVVFQVPSHQSLKHFATGAPVDLIIDNTPLLYRGFVGTFSGSLRRWTPGPGVTKAFADNFATVMVPADQFTPDQIDQATICVCANQCSGKASAQPDFTRFRTNTLSTDGVVHRSVANHARVVRNDTEDYLEHDAATYVMRPDGTPVGDGSCNTLSVFDDQTMYAHCLGPQAGGPGYNKAYRVPATVPSWN